MDRPATHRPVIAATEITTQDSRKGEPDHRFAVQSSMGTTLDRLPPGVARSTVGRILACYRKASVGTSWIRRLAWQSAYICTSPTPGNSPSQLVHVDIKKLGKIPDGGGHRMLGCAIGDLSNGKKGRGCAYIRHAADIPYLTYSKILADERKETA